MPRRATELLTILLAAGTLCLVGLLVFREPPTQAPSVPNLIPPKCAGRCGSASIPPRPLRVVCPYCRNTFLATWEPATGEVGAVPDKPAAK